MPAGNLAGGGSDDLFLAAAEEEEERRRIGTESGEEKGNEGFHGNSDCQIS